MGAISNFVAAYDRDFDEYSAIEKRVEALCKVRLRNTKFLWQSRVKTSASLEKKLRDRSNEYKDEAANVDNVLDLVGGRIIVARRKNILHVARMVKKTFKFVRQTQHPKDSQNKVDSETRFRGYNALHLYVKLQGPLDEQYRNPVIEIQVMTAFMWIYATLHHDVVYKRLHGKPTKGLLLVIDFLRGLANLGENVLEMYDKLFVQKNIYPDLQTSVQSVFGEGAFSELEAQSQRILQLKNPQHDKDRAESSTGQRCEDSALEEWAYALLRKQTRNKEAHLEGVAEARKTLLQGMTMSSQDGLPTICDLRKLHHLAVAERKLSQRKDPDTSERKKHLDQAEAYMDEAVGLVMLSGLVGAREQMTLERHIVRGLRAKLEFRMRVGRGENARRLLSDAIAGIKQALENLEKVDMVKYGKNEKFAWEWIDYFQRLYYKSLFG